MTDARFDQIVSQSRIQMLLQSRTRTQLHDATCMRYSLSTALVQPQAALHVLHARLVRNASTWKTQVQLSAFCGPSVYAAAVAESGAMLSGRQCQHSGSHLLRRCHPSRLTSLHAKRQLSRQPKPSKQKQTRPQPKRTPCLDAVSSEALNRALTEGADWGEPAEGFNSIPEALGDIAEGKFVVVLDDEGRENEGDLIIAAEHMTTEAMAFMVEHTSGVICVPLEGRYVSDLLPVLHTDNVPFAALDAISCVDIIWPAC